MIVSLFENAVQIDPNVIVTKEIKVVGSSVYTREEMEKAISLIEDNIVDVNSLISKVVSIEEGPETFEFIEINKTLAKTLIKP